MSLFSSSEQLNLKKLLFLMNKKREIKKKKMLFVHVYHYNSTFNKCIEYIK